MFTTLFWKGTFERAVKTFAQVLLAFFTGDTVFDVVNFTWEKGLTVAGTAALVSVLTSLVSSKVGNTETPSLVGEEV